MGTSIGTNQHATDATEPSDRPSGATGADGRSIPPALSPPPLGRAGSDPAGSRYAAIRLRVRVFLYESGSGNRAARACSVFLVVLICLNVAAVVLESVEEIHAAARALFHWFEVFSVSIFTLEYALRLWSCTAGDERRSPLRGRLRFATRPLLIVDLLAILPFYLPLLAGLDLRTLRAVRLMRLLRLFKIARYSESLRIIGSVLHRKRQELAVTVFSVFVLLVVASSLIYAVEREAQADKFGSIPAAMWWGVTTLTTVGYGDVYPVTPVGKLLGAIIAILGIGVFALPTGILGAGFIEELQRRRGSQTVCPHCGRKIDN
jgi:voltage-gated potassium channel